MAGLSLSEYTRDTLILAGDVSDNLDILRRCIEALARRFRHVLFVPGNHELWVWREPAMADSCEKFEAVSQAAVQSGATMQPLRLGRLRIVPLLSWYDYSFGLPGDYLRRAWADFRACRWPAGWQPGDVADWFFARNQAQPCEAGETLISFSHFMPRVDLMPPYVPEEVRALYPVLGAARIDDEIRRLGASLHLYGHSHLNRSRDIDGVRYVNNALGYPHEARIAARRLVCVHDGLGI
jgi:3',5'-cyclic AMP phosphodiesterase CpdA